MKSRIFPVIGMKKTQSSDPFTFGLRFFGLHLRPMINSNYLQVKVLQLLVQLMDSANKTNPYYASKLSI